MANIDKADTLKSFLCEKISLPSKNFGVKFSQSYDVSFYKTKKAVKDLLLLKPRDSIMRQVCLLFVAAMSLSGLCFSSTSQETQDMSTQVKHPVVLIKTTAGDIKVELDAEKAPGTVKNFLQYVNEGFYNGTVFHRVIDGFMVQGGGFTKDMQQKPVHSPIKIESDNGLKNTRGTIAMARTSDVNSATAQFFFNVVDNSFLDFKSKTPSGYGYAVFGHVTEGLDVLDKMRKAKTSTKGPFENVPVEAIEIIDVKQVN